MLLLGEGEKVTAQNVGDVLKLSVQLHDKSLLDVLLDRFVELAEPALASSVVKAMSELLDLSLDGMLERVGKVKKMKSSNSFYKEILLSCQVEIKDAEQLLADKKISLDKDGVEDFLQFCYGDKYVSYKRKRFFIDLIKKPFRSK